MSEKLTLMDKACECMLKKQQADNKIIKSRNEIVCPYCGHIHYDYGENSLFYLDLDDFINEECECEECNQTFFVTRRTIVAFRSSKKKLI